jgi:hypothetical protein
MSAHAVLSPSGASRWLACTPSARLEQTFPDSAGIAAREGTLAHALGELLLLHALGRVTETTYENRLATIQSNDLYNTAMFGHAEDYATFVLERFAEAKAGTPDAILEIEVKLDLTEYIQQGFGTGDAVIIADGTLELIDMKYGKGVEVSAFENKQMMLYGLGALKFYALAYDIHDISMTIFQPRLENFSNWSITVEHLRAWGDTVLRPRAALAFAGEGEFQPGTHCRFCRAKAVCRANADYQLEKVRKDFAAPDLLTDEEIADVLERVSGIENWLTAVKDFALVSAVNDGKKWPGFKLVEGRSNRVIADEEKVVARLRDLSYGEELIYNKKIKGIGDLEKLLGKKGFAEELGQWVVKPKGKPTLVPESDKRPEISSADSAKADFAEVEIE